MEEEFDSWLSSDPTKKPPPPPPEDNGGASSWWTPVVPSLPTLPTDTAQLGSLLWGAAVRVKETVAESIDGNLHEFNAERERVLAEARRLQPVTSGDASSEGLPPWRVLAEQYQILEEDLRTQMLQLSLTQSTFLEAPSSGSPAYDYKALLPTCMAALREDEALRQRRFELVPKRLDERTFWANYLDKVYQIKDAILATSTLPAMPAVPHAAAARPPPAAAPPAPTAEADGLEDDCALDDDGELEDDDGVELNSDDDIDKLLDLGDDEEDEEEDAR